jgi:fructose-bisphosphate aldolase class 1
LGAQESINQTHKYLIYEKVPVSQTIFKCNLLNSAKDTLSLRYPIDLQMVAFLSGGVDDGRVISILNEMNKEDLQLRFTYSFGRTLQRPALDNWNLGTQMVQEKFIERCKQVSLASQGKL